MKKTINKIVKTIKTIVLLIVIVAILYGAYLVTQYVNGQKVSVENPNFSQAKTETKNSDEISEAQKKLKEVEDKLQAEEAKLNSQKEKEDVRHETESNRIETEKERIREVRMSFTVAQTPTASSTR